MRECRELFKPYMIECKFSPLSRVVWVIPNQLMRNSKQLQLIERQSSSHWQQSRIDLPNCLICWRRRLTLHSRCCSMGLDSLIAAELRNWLFKTFGVEVDLLQLLGKAMRIDDIAELVVTRLRTQ